MVTENASPVSAITGGGTGQPLPAGYNPGNTATSPKGTQANAPASSTTYAAAPTAPDPGAGFKQFVGSPLGQYLASLNGQSPSVAQNYMNVFQGALGSARSDIQQQLAGALSDIKSNQAYAQQALGQLPGQINQSYGTANQMTGAGEKVAQAGMNAPGLNAATGANTGGSLSSYAAPIQAAINGEQKADLANVPLLATGIQQAGSQEAAAANNAALSDYGNLAQQQAQLAGQAQIAAMQQQGSLTAQQQQNQYGLVNNALQNQYSLGQIAASNSASTGYGSPAQVQQVVNSPQYASAVQAVQSGQYKNLAALQAAYPGNPVLWQTVASQYGLK